MNFNKQLRNIRKKAGYTQKQVAQALGIQESAYQRFEQGITKEPRLGTLIALADFFDVSLDYLVGRSDKK